MVVQIDIESSNNPRRLKRHIERLFMDEGITRKELIDIKFDVSGGDLTALIIYEK